MVEIILKKSIKKLGEKYSLVTVKDGYANYLIAQDVALQGTEANKNNLAEFLKQNEQRERKMMQAIKNVGKKLDSIQLIFEEKVDENGRLFATITPLKIVEAYKAHDITIDQKQITILNAPIKEVGMHKATVLLHKNLEKTIHFDIQGSK